MEALIEHNEYLDGAVQSLAIVEGEKQQWSSGVVLPGEHNFGTASRKEVIRVTLGVLQINGEYYTVDSDPAQIELGDQILIAAEIPSAYICCYG